MIISYPLKNHGLGVVVYYYPHIPYRIQFESINSNISIDQRLEKAMNNSLQKYDPFESIEVFLKLEIFH